MEKKGIVIERAIVQQDVMVAPIDFIHQIFRDNEWMNLFTSTQTYPKSS
jgi:hypothetical protein